MKTKLSIKINKIIIILTLISVLLQGVFIIYAGKQRMDAIDEASNIVVETINYHIKKNIGDLKKYIRTFSFDTYVGNFANADTAVEKYKEINGVRKVSILLSAYSNVYEIVIKTKDGSYYAFSDSDLNLDLNESIDLSVSEGLSPPLNSEFSRITEQKAKLSTKLDCPATYYTLRWGSNSYRLNRNVYEEENISISLVDEYIVMGTPIYVNDTNTDNYYKNTGEVLFFIKTNALYNPMDISDYENMGISFSAGKSIPYFKNDYDFIYKSIYIDSADATLTITIPRGYLIKNIGSYLPWIVLNLVLNVVFIFIIARLINKNLTRPIENINLQMIGMSGNRKKKRIDYHGDDEIGDIVREINKLLLAKEGTSRQIFETQMKLYESEILKNRAHLYALQLQINPHFLYNTLSCIKSFALINNVKEISQIIDSMTRILRYSIKEEDVVTVEEEINFIKEYINIINIRFESKYNFHINIDPKSLHCSTLKMILQPLIENSIEHGLHENDVGNLWLNVVLNKNLIIEIIDDGVGFSQIAIDEFNEQKNLKDYSNESIGILNVQNRIESKYGSEYGIEIENYKLTKIRIIQPYILEEE
ncbi:MAG: sensor histidine kinase [Lachnospirales bacterium]